jgi:hypothetical protein
VKQRQEIVKIFRDIREKTRIPCEITWRHAGRYWEDLFPEFFEKDPETHEPLYEDLFRFRKEADKLKKIENIENLYRKICKTRKFFDVKEI